ncbi:MAG: transglycosylase SLT domain-containing protein [Candidatus Bipolaricaulaceae bacterium]
MKWALFALAFGAVLFLVQILWPSSALAPYETLSQALTAPEKHLPELWSLAGREDAAGWVARLELSKVLLQNGGAQAAVVLLREALSIWDSREARKLLAQALEKNGQREEALAEWKKLLPDEEASAAVLRLEKDRISAGRTLVAGKAYKQALTILADLKQAEAGLLRARALAGLGRLNEAAQEYERYLAASPADSQAHLEYGQILERLGQKEKALEAYRAAGKKGAYRLGLLLEGSGALDEAISAYLRAEEPEAKWRAACLLEAQGRINEALSLYRELAKSSARLADDAAFRAYLILSRQGRMNEAKVYKKDLPPAFIWLLNEPAPSRLFVPDPQGSAPAVLNLADELITRFPPHGKGWAYIALGMALARASPAEKLAIAEWYGKNRDWNRAYAIGVELIQTNPSPRAYRLAYPKAWEESVWRWAREYEVDPLLIWAVMREESGFLPTAVSSSGACGLMQLLPSTARWIAEEKLGISFREALLFDPDYNIRLGAWYLRYLLDQFGGEVVLAVAAYNAGPGNLRRWTQGLASLADLPSRLRSPETREYLVKVLNSWLIYRELYGN